MGSEMPLVVRLHPLGATTMAIARQFDGPRSASSPIALLRSVPEDALATAFEMLPLTGTDDPESVAEAWAEAQLAADATLLGFALGLRVALVADAGLWYADLLVIRTGRRLRSGRGYGNPTRALQVVRRSALASLGADDDQERWEESMPELPPPARVPGSGRR